MQAAVNELIAKLEANGPQYKVTITDFINDKHITFGHLAERTNYDFMIMYYANKYIDKESIDKYFSCITPTYTEIPAIIAAGFCKIAKESFHINEMGRVVWDCACIGKKNNVNLVDIAADLNECSFCGKLLNSGSFRNIHVVDNKIILSHNGTNVVIAKIIPMEQE